MSDSACECICQIIVPNDKDVLNIPIADAYLFKEIPNDESFNNTNYRSDNGQKEQEDSWEIRLIYNEQNSYQNNKSYNINLDDLSSFRKNRFIGSARLI